MHLRRYQNEMIVAVSLLLMVAAFLFKEGQISTKEEQVKVLQDSVSTIQEVMALKEIWDDKQADKKVKALHTTVAPSKVKWSQKSKKVTASYQGLSVEEFNTLLNTLLNLGVKIELLDVKKADTLYDVELKCTW